MMASAFFQPAGEAVILPAQLFIFLDYGVSPPATPAAFSGLEGLDGTLTRNIRLHP